MRPAPAEAVHSGCGLRFAHRLYALGPLVGLIVLCIVGTLINRDFATLDDLMNVLTRTSFIGIIAVGMTFVIISDGIDLSVGSMAALIAGCMIWLMNGLAVGAGGNTLAPLLIVTLGFVLAPALGGLFGCAHGLLITKGRIEPSSSRRVPRHFSHSADVALADGGALTPDNSLSDCPTYTGRFMREAVFGGKLHRRGVPKSNGNC